MIKLYWFVSGTISMFFGLRAAQVAVGYWSIPLTSLMFWLTVLITILFAGLVFWIIEKTLVEKGVFECWINGHELMTDANGKVYCNRCGRKFDFK